jgi:hypothetical protein
VFASPLLGNTFLNLTSKLVCNLFVVNFRFESMEPLYSVSLDITFWWNKGHVKGISLVSHLSDQLGLSDLVISVKTIVCNLVRSQGKCLSAWWEPTKFITLFLRKALYHKIASWLVKEIPFLVSISFRFNESNKIVCEQRDFFPRTCLK